MKRILFLSLCAYETVEIKDIYTDLLRALIGRGYDVVIASPLEKKYKKAPRIIREDHCEIVEILIDDYFNVGALKKGFSLLSIDRRFKNALAKKYGNTAFDMVLYATPPIMFIKTIRYFKSKGAFAYLMLKDIFPQNAVDIQMMSKRGIGGVIYGFFRHKEKKIYALSDKIGCMSPANAAYVLSHNPDIRPDKVEVCPNCLDAEIIRLRDEEKDSIRQLYGLPRDKTIFVYGGNLGKPQGIPFILECLKSQKNNHDACFVIVGDGSEFGKLEQYQKTCGQENFVLMKRLDRHEFDRLIAACDVGLLFLDFRFTIPNFPSRLLSYMKAQIPVLACTDEATDVGTIIAENGFGWRCTSHDVNGFCSAVNQILADGTDTIKDKGRKGGEYFLQHYSSAGVASIIERNMEPDHES